MLSKSKVILILLLSISIALIACHSKKTSQSTGEYQKITEKGKIIEHVICKKNINQNYALYLPSTYSPDKKYPIIYFFDPHAKGIQVIKKYSTVAEKYGFIIAASNMSKNGLSWEYTNEIYDNLYDDTYNKLSIDKQRIYTAGFSGGARVASSIAIFKGGIAGVIACGAGFPQINEPIKNKFNFIGIVGTADFNFIEMNNLNSALNDTPIPHYLITFNGKHEWPSVDIMSDGFMWLIINSMKDKYITTDEQLIKNFILKNIDSINNRNKNIQIEEIYETYNKIVSYSSGILEITNYKKTLDSIYNSQNYTAYLKNEKEINTLENHKMQEYIIAFKSKPTNWWKTEINNLSLNISNKKNISEINLNKRLINYISMLSYVSIDNSLKSNSFEKIKDYLNIYFMADSLNPDYKYLFGCYCMKQNKYEKALQYLEEAVKSGFNDLNKIEDDGYFIPLIKNNKYLEIISLIKN